MSQLILVSTYTEIAEFFRNSGLPESIGLNLPVQVNKDFEIMISGVGCPETIFSLTNLLCKRSFDRIIQVGIAGSYKRDIEPGTLVEVQEDCFADLGIDNLGHFTSVFAAGLSDPDQKPFRNGRLINPHTNETGFQPVNAITVNTVSGSKTLVEQRFSTYFPDIESMEGAAAFFVCFHFNIPVLQVRSISNFVEPRNKDKWKMDLALSNLNNWLGNFVS